MAKDIRVTVDDERHEDWSDVKGDDNTWEDVLAEGIAAMRGGHDG